MRRHCIAAVLTVTLAAAIGPAAKGQSVWKKLTDNGLSIRKNFDGTKDEQNPAAFMYLRERTAPDPEFSVIDVAVKLVERELLPQSPSTSWLVFPVADYHRSSNTAGRVSKAGISLKTEFRPFGMGPAVPGSRGIFLPLAPTLIADAKLARDWEKDVDETKFGGQVFLSGVKTGLPGSQWRVGGIRGRYYLYGGADRYRFFAGNSDTLLTTAYGRAWLELLPFVTDSTMPLQVVAEATSRHRVSSDDGYPKQLSDFTIGANIYPGGQDFFGIGLDYANGRDAAKRFRRREGVFLSVKLKL